MSGNLMTNLDLMNHTAADGRNGYMNVSKEFSENLPNDYWFNSEDLPIGSVVWVKPRGNTPEYVHAVRYNIRGYSPVGKTALLLRSESTEPSLFWVDCASFSKFWTLLDYQVADDSV